MGRYQENFLKQADTQGTGRAFRFFKILVILSSPVLHPGTMRRRILICILLSFFVSCSDSRKDDKVASDVPLAQPPANESLPVSGLSGKELSMAHCSGCHADGRAFTYSSSTLGQTSSTLRVGWDFKLSDNWRIDYSTIYDVEARERSGQYIGVTRDLHCWEIGFSRQQLGDEWEYYFRIALKAHPELYGESGNRGVGGGLMGQF